MSIEVRYGMIPGGRAGNGYQSGMIIIPTTPSELEDAIEDGDVIDITPNDGDFERLLEAVVAGALFVDWDVFGEGVIALSTDAEPEAIELAARRKFDE